VLLFNPTEFGRIFAFGADLPQCASVLAQPRLCPAAIFLPGGRAALGTAQGDVFVVDCAAGIAPGDTLRGRPENKPERY
jgi:hypothetical protein